MAYDELLADRIRAELKRKSVAFEEKKMMGGITFMVDDKMCMGVTKNDLMARVDPESHESLLEKKGARTMDFTKRVMKGYLFIEPIGVETDDELDYWLSLCLDFNPKAKSSKKR